MLIGKKMVFEKVDGVLPEQKERRDQLFAISGQRGKYPQCFIESESGCRFIGLWDELESLVDCDDLPADVLAANPNIATFSKVLRRG